MNERPGMATFPRSRAWGSREEEQKPEDSGLSAEAIDTGDVAGNLRHLLPLVCVSDNAKYSNSKRVRHLNDLAKVIKRADHNVEPSYPAERIIECARLSLLSGVKEVRAGALRVLRYLLTTREAFIVMLKHCIDFLVTRCLDAPPNREIERLQAVRFIRQALSVCPRDVTRALVAPLVAIVLSGAEPQDNLTWTCVATLCELALNNPELAARTGTIKALVRGLLKCHTPRISESVILTLSHLLNCPGTRKYISSQFDLESLLAPITDLHYCHQPNESTSRSGESTKTANGRVEASKMALVSLLKCWPGIFCLCSHSNLGMTSLLNMLPLAKPEVQREILDVLYGVFQLKVPEWTSNYNEALASIDPAQSKNEWSLMEGFVAEEGNDLLPPKSVDRTNLIDCYQALLLAALMEEGLFHVLAETVCTANRHVTVMATILMGELLHLTNVILPPGYSSNAHCLPDLIASALDFQDTNNQRNGAAEAISCLDRIHQLKKEGMKPSSLFLKLILDQSGYFAKKDDFNHIPSELDEASLANLIKDTKVLHTKEYDEWDWSLLFSFLQHPSLKVTHINEDALFSRFIKRLCNFYKPSNHVYSHIPYSEANSKRYSSVGQKLVQYLCRVQETNTRYLFDLVSDMVLELGQVTASKLTADVFSSISISHKMSRDYFLLLGTISFHKPLLLDQCKAYGPLLSVCNYQNRSDLMKLIISSLDFAHDVHSQVILSKILTSSDKDMRLHATKHLRVLLRAKMPFFNSWGLEMLIPQLYDTDKEVAIEAADILDEACEEESFLKALVLQQPQLLHLGEKGEAIQTRFFSVKRGFALMSRLGYLKSLQERWSESTNKLYVYIVEEKLAESLTSFKHVQDSEFVRRTCTSVINPKAFVPVHLYGQLAQHVEGCALLEKENYVPQFAEVIRMDCNHMISHDQIITFKAAIWALGHIGSSAGGMDLLVREGVVANLVTLAERCPVLSIRGTSYYALCLISKTPRGADILADLNWTTVCHSLAEKWPLACSDVLSYADSAFSPGGSPVKPAPGRSRHISTPPCYRSPSPETGVKKKAHQSVSTPVESPKKSSPIFIKFHSTTTDPSPGSRYRSASNKLTQSLQHGRVRPSMLPMATHSHSLQRRRVRPVSTISASGISPFSRSQSVSSQTFSQRQSVSGMNNPFVGVSLPVDITKMFEYHEPAYKGFITETFGAPDFTKDQVPHNPYKCLECSIALNKTYRRSHSGGDLSNSSENIPYAHQHGGSCNSLSPFLRSRSHTSESMASSGNNSHSNSSSSRSDSKQLSTEAGELKSSQEMNGESPIRESRKKQPVCPKSPLVRMKRVISDGVDMIQRPVKTEPEVESMSKESRVLFSPGGSSGREGGGEEEEDEEGNEGDAEEEDEEGKVERREVVESPQGGQEVMINVIKPSVRHKEQKLKVAVSNSGDSGGTKDTSDTGSMSSIGASDNVNKLHLTYLEVVYGLSSDVSLKKNSTTLNQFSLKYPELIQDVCLYSKVLNLLSTFQYNLNTRRFIQSKFDKLTFATIFAARPQPEEEFSEEDFLLSSACSSRRESFSSLDTDNHSIGSGSAFRLQHRRRSSTSDAAKFKEKFQNISRSVDEQLVAESPGEGEIEGDDSSESGQGSSGTGHGSSETGQPSHGDDSTLTNVKSAWSKADGSGGREARKEEEGRARKGVLNMTSGKEGDKGSRDSTVATSVVNVGFDL